MEKRQREKRIVAGVCCLAVGALVTGWTIGSFVPATPRPPTKASEISQDGGWGSGPYSTIEAESVRNIPFGRSGMLEGLTQGKLYWVGSEESLEGKTEAERAEMIEKNNWVVELAPVSVKVGNTKIVSLEGFKEWYPHYEAARVGESEPNGMLVVLVEAEVQNLSQEAADIPPFTLWTDFGSNDVSRLDSGWYIDNKYLSAELYGVPQDDRVQYALPDGWNTLEAGETQTRILPFLAPERAFPPADAEGNRDLSHFCIATWDCDPATVYRFWLG